MRTVVIVPTYNERSNILRLLTALREFVLEVLVVDGNSPDGTAKIVEEYAKLHAGVHLLVEEKKQGLGGAYIAGMQYALGALGADIICEMDADFQHDPRDLPRLLRAIEEGADVAVGTRFTQGGSIPPEWVFYRRLLSRFGNFYARALAGMWRYHDITSGFRATRVEYLRRVNLEGLRSRRFAYKIDLFYRLHALGARIVEVPIAFGYREEGSSKQEMKLTPRNDFLDSLRVVHGIFFERLIMTFRAAVRRVRALFREFFRYGIASIFTYAFLFGGMYVAVDLLRFQPSPSYVVIYGISYVMTYALAGTFIFQKGFARQSAIRFFCHAAFFWAFGNILFNVFLQSFSIHYLWVVAINVCVMAAVRFLSLRYFVFRGRA